VIRGRTAPRTARVAAACKQTRMPAVGVVVVYIYSYIAVCVCVCVCAEAEANETSAHGNARLIIKPVHEQHAYKKPAPI
jgi:hypothetical protein